MDRCIGFAGMDDVPTEDLHCLKRAIEIELHKRAAKIGEGLCAQIRAKIMETISSGFSVRIETDSDEIELTEDDIDDIVVSSLLE